MKERAVFVIKIYDQKHGTWQGRLTGIGKNESESHNFRSVLEMLKLMDEGMGRQKNFDKDDTAEAD